MRYEGAVYRPPSEARSLILQITVGCSHNSCSFCTMYRDKRFHIRKEREIFEDIDEAAKEYAAYSFRVFLADGDALVLATDKLVRILTYIKKKLPYVERITSYATARDILRKSDEELALLRSYGLEMVYVGAESGSRKVLEAVNKGVTVEELIDASEKLKKAGIKLSLTLISGLGGKELLEEHAQASAALVTAMKPEYLGFLTLMLNRKAPIMKEIDAGRLTLLDPDDVTKEMEIFLQNVDAEGTVFRSNHASNYLTLKGNLNRDKAELLRVIEQAREKGRYRSEYFRSL